MHPSVARTPLLARFAADLADPVEYEVIRTYRSMACSLRLPGSTSTPTDSSLRARRRPFHASMAGRSASSRGAGRKRSCENNAAGVDRVEACAAAEAAGTEIFVIAAMHPDHVSGHLAPTLRACSSEIVDSDGTYVFLNNSTPENLKAAFTGIANQLSAVRWLY